MKNADNCDTDNQQTCRAVQQPRLRPRERPMQAGKWAHSTVLGLCCVFLLDRPASGAALRVQLSGLLLECTQVLASHALPLRFGIVVLMKHRLPRRCSACGLTTEAAKVLCSFSAPLTTIFPAVCRAAGHRRATLTIYRNRLAAQDAVNVQLSIPPSPPCAKFGDINTSSSIQCA